MSLSTPILTVLSWASAWVASPKLASATASTRRRETVNVLISIPLPVFRARMAVLRGLALRRLIVCCRNESGVFSTGDRSTQTYYHSNDRQAPLRVGCDIVASKQASAGGHRESHREPRYFPNRAASKAFTPCVNQRRVHGTSIQTHRIGRR